MNVRKMTTSLASKGICYFKNFSSFSKVKKPIIASNNRIRILKEGTTLTLTKHSFPVASINSRYKGSHVCQVSVAPINPSNIEVPKEAHGFELIQREFIKEYDSDVLFYKHKKTGAELLSLMNEDENKTFGVTFRTPIENSTGCPHILEHSLLGGSRKYNVKEPFVELIKGSLNTFLNAFTYPDRTCFPVASCNTQDFYNLIDVYLDCLFFPRVIEDERIFKQEGWRYELKNEKAPLEYKGVVYNEMKGVYSSADERNFRNCMKLLFPNNNYHFCSGGEPEEIIKLSYQELKNFYENCYHPSNARIWMYGNDDPVKRLEILNEYLNEFEQKKVDTEIKRQPLLKEPMKVIENYPSSETETKAFVSLNWVLSENTFNLEERLELSFLDYLLTGTPASSLYKALTESNLGESIIGGGITDEFLQPFMSIGLKGVDLENSQKVIDLIMNELERLSKEGFSESAIEAALNSIEFDLRENNTGRFPRGLSLMLRAAFAWNYGQDPIQSLKWEEPLKKLKEKLKNGEPVFQNLIKSLILDNPHKLTLEMHPDPLLGPQILSKEKRGLITKKESMTPEEVKEVIEDTQEIQEWQEKANTPEDLKCIPVLKISDIDKNIIKIPTEISSIGSSTTLITHDLFTNDILYMEYLMELKTLPAKLLPLVPLFCEAMTQIGTEKESFVELTERIGRKTGGIAVSPFISNKRESDEPVAKICISGKVMKDKIEDMTQLMDDILLTAKLDDKERFKQMALESKAGYEAAIKSSGNRFAVARLAAQDSVAGWANEMLGGVSYLFFLRELVERIDNDWDSVLNDLNTIRDYVVNDKGSIVNLTADKKTIDLAIPSIEKLLLDIPITNYDNQKWDMILPKENELISVVNQVNHVAKGINLFKETGYTYDSSSLVVTKHLFVTWLWERVRAKGGAYGCSTALNSESGLLTMASFRDPNFYDTLDNFDAASDYLKDLTLDDDAITKAIIGTMGDVDAHQLPDAKGHSALLRYLIGIDDEERQKRRDKILSTTEKDFKAFGEYLNSLKSDKANVVAVVSDGNANEIELKSPDTFKITKIT